MDDYIQNEMAADIAGVSKRTMQSWVKNKKVDTLKGLISLTSLSKHSRLALGMLNSHYDKEQSIIAKKQYNCIELFAGAGGLALGMESAGFNTLALNEMDKHACNTLRLNRPHWNVLEGDIHNLAFSKYKNTVDVLSGGFPCQSFSYAGKRQGFEDTRGTLFFQFARAIKEIAPTMVIMENVRGLLTHENGRTLKTIYGVMDELGYHMTDATVLKAIAYRVPQKRERLFMIAIKKSVATTAAFDWPSPYNKILTMRDALYQGELYDTDAPRHTDVKYPKSKCDVMDMVPPGGNWTSLPDDIQRQYMQKSYFLGGGKTGMARRLSLDSPSLTLTCSPAQKQTERCHPSITRPLNVREYARVQTFPDSWEFAGPMTAKYKQIGNAVPVNLANAVAKKVIATLNDIS